MTAQKKRSPAQIYQIKVTLRDSKPPIWRRIQVPGNITLYDLHYILQLVMGWQNSHLHMFIIDGTQYGDLAQLGTEIPAKDEDRARLDKVVPSEHIKFDYDYDFGDSWEHILLVEKIIPPEPDARYPRCVKGKRACPPEDCGGIWGYQELVEVLAHPEHPDHQEMLEWVGGSFDPEAFSIGAINAALATY